MLNGEAKANWLMSRSRKMIFDTLIVWKELKEIDNPIHKHMTQKQIMQRYAWKRWFDCIA